ncbi:hypothetical protein ACFL2Q_13945 [Thermodesulfobacteriota bacterium]
MKKLMIVLLSVALLILFSVSAFAEIKIGILAKRGPEVVKQRWTDLGNYLTEKTGEKVYFVPLKFTEVMLIFYTSICQALDIVS